MKRDLLAPHDLGQIYGVSSDTVLRWHHSGLIPAAVAAGQVYRFDAEEVAEALRAHADKKAKAKAKRKSSAALI